MFHNSYLHVTHVKQTPFFVTHKAASLIMELHQPATSINLSCHITSTPRLVLLQPSNLSRIFTTTHTLLKHNHPLETTPWPNFTLPTHRPPLQPRSFCLCADNTNCTVATCSGNSYSALPHLENIHNCLSLSGWFCLAVCPSSFRLWFARSAVCWFVLYMTSASLSVCLSVYLFIIRLPLSVESRFGVCAYSPGKLFSRVETTAWCSTLKIHLPIIPCPALL